MFKNTLVYSCIHKQRNNQYETVNLKLHPVWVLVISQTKHR